MKQVAVWSDEQVAKYELNEATVLRMLDSMMLIIPDMVQMRRVEEIKYLVGEKKAYLLSIHADLE